MKILNLIKFGIFFIIFCLFSILFNVVLGFLGIQFFYGTISALIITILCLYFKLLLPIYVGSYFGMINVLNWHWSIALIVCLPGLLFITPNLFKKILRFNFLNNNEYANRFYRNKSKFNKETVKTNVKNEEIIDGEYEVIKDDEKK